MKKSALRCFDDDEFEDCVGPPVPDVINSVDSRQFDQVKASTAEDQPPGSGICLSMVAPIFVSL